jgi:hypothetical protein
MPHAYLDMATAISSVRVSRETLSELERFQRALGSKSLDEAIRTLLVTKRKELIDQIYGSARGMRAFRESDRLDSDR